jgi:hypothetical protein
MNPDTPTIHTSFPVKSEETDGLPTFPVATVVGHCSVDASGEYHADQRSLRYYYPPPTLPLEPPTLYPAFKKQGYTSEPGRDIPNHGRERTYPRHASHVGHPRESEDEANLDLNSLYETYTPKENPIEPLDRLLRGIQDHGIAQSK